MIKLFNKKAILVGAISLFVVLISKAQHKIYLEETVSYLEELEESGFSGQVYLSVSGDTKLNSGYGLADRNSGRRVTNETVFDIGSLTKYYTLAAILKLSEQNKLSVDDTLGEILEHTPADKSRVTIRQIIDMEAGLPEYVPGVRSDFEAITKEEAISRILSAPLAFEPGNERRYSNAGYTLLAAIIENVSGLEYEEFLQTHIFATAVFKHGFYGKEYWEKEESAYGYDDLTVQGDNSPYHWPGLSWALKGAGGIVTSTSGLVEWLKATYDGKILDEKHTQLFDLLMEKMPTSRGTEAMVRVGGGSYGFASGIAYYPKEGIIVAVNTNSKKFPADGIVLRQLLTCLLTGVKSQEEKPGAFSDERNSNSTMEVEVVKGLDEMSLVEIQLFSLAEAMSIGGKELKAFIKNEFDPSFIEQFSLDGHYNFLSNNFPNGIEITELIKLEEKSVVVEGINLADNQGLTITAQISDEGKIALIRIED